MKFLILIFGWFTVTAGVCSTIKHIDLASHEKGQAKLTVQFDELLKSDPEMKVGTNFLQLELKDSVVWPKIDRKVEIEGVPHTIMGYQYQKDLVRVRIVFNTEISENLTKERIQFNNSGNTIELIFPIQKNEKSASFKPVKLDGEAYLKKAISNIRYDDTPLVFKEDAVVKSDVVDIKLAQAEKAKNTNEILDTRETNDNKMPSMSWFYVKLFGFMIMIVGVFWFGAKFLRDKVLKQNRFSFLKNNELISVISTTYLAPKKSLILVKVHNQVLLLSSSEQGVNYITEIDDLTGVLKSSEKALGGANFDEVISSRKNIASQDDKIHLKENIEKSYQHPLASFLAQSKNNPSRKSAFDKIKNKNRDAAKMERL